MSCKAYKIIVEQYTEGIIEDRLLEDLQHHLKQCSECRRSFQEFSLMQQMLKESLTDQNSDDHKKNISLKIAQQDRLYPRPGRSSHRFSQWFGYAIAAGFFLAIGLFVGSGDRMHALFTRPEPLAILISDLKGDILIKHPWENHWKALASDESIYEGDSFLSLHQSAVKLVLGPDKYVELNENSSLHLMQYNSQTEFGIAYGTVKSSLNGPHEPFFISTPQGRLEALGTEFIVQVR